MKKLLLIVTLLIVFLGAVWFFVLRDKTVPISESVGGLLPFGSGSEVNIPFIPQENTATTTAQDENISTENKLFRISSAPVAGFVILPYATSSSKVRYVDRATGHIFDVPLPRAGDDNVERVKVTNNTLPQIYEALFRNDGTAVLLRSLDDNDLVTNTSLTLTPPRTVGTSTEARLYSITSTELRGNMDSVVVGAGNSLYYVLKDIPAISTSGFDGSGVRNILTTALKDWGIGRFGSNLLVYPKAHSQVPGTLYSLNTQSGALSKILGPLNGLTALANNSGTRILYSFIENGGINLAVRDVQAGTSSAILPGTLSEKCTWANKNNNLLFCGTSQNMRGSEPENWYLGKTHFSDFLWQVNIETDTSKVVVDPEADFDLNLDISEPKVSLNDDYFVFINKTDLTLWAVKLQ